MEVLTPAKQRNDAQILNMVSLVQGVQGKLN
jgi:hypothetical protein